ncbi:hypothetical protein HQ308_14915 [Rhodococcus sp. BP-241]|uniref:hypothetical protein n=1 Tax=Rhodococcus sp. BP-241 TaxID=2739441 RepID=UPI001C9B2DB1|nr:hypothetical protein [Rhodococcus sp. BP-241]MBY6708095.1 hypothetical protein [Rhodococcus sp. BP-241]
MSNIRSSNSNHNRIAREAYVRARAAAVEAVTRRGLDERTTRTERSQRRERSGASALAPAAMNVSIGRLAACAGAAAVVSATARAEMDTAPSEDALMASMRADAYESAWHERLVDFGVDVDGLRADFDSATTFTPDPDGSAALEMLLAAEFETVAEDALDAVVEPTWEPVSRAELAAPPTGLAGAGQYLDNGDDVADIVERSRTWSLNLDDGVDL